jgi:hypothetical protein
MIKFPENPKSQQTKMLLSTHSQLLKIYRQLVKEGVYSWKEVDRKGWIHRFTRRNVDGNIERALSVAFKFTAQISERDRHYAAYVGTMYLLAEKELRELNLSPAEIKAQIKRQWGDDLSFLTDSQIEGSRRDFTEVMLTNSLANLVDFKQ